MGDERKPAVTATTEHSGLWQERSVVLVDAPLGNRSPSGSDLPLHGVDGEDDPFHRMELTRGP